MAIRIKSCGGSTLSAEDLSALNCHVVKGFTAVTKDSVDLLNEIGIGTLEKEYVLETAPGAGGTMPDKGNWSYTLSSAMYEINIPEGYHNGSGKVNVAVYNGE